MPGPQQSAELQGVSGSPQEPHTRSDGPIRKPVPPRMGRFTRYLSNLLRGKGPSATMEELADMSATSKAPKGGEVAIEKPPLLIGNNPLDLEAIFKTPDHIVRMEVPPKISGEKPISVETQVTESSVEINTNQYNNPPFHFVAQVFQDNGVNTLSMSVKNRDENGNPAEGFPRIGPLTDAALAFLDSRCDIPQFQAQWFPVSGSDNFAQYEAGLASGLTPEQAAFQTYSGQRIAKAHGFTEFLGIQPVELSPTLIGWRVMFGRKKPQSTSQPHQ